MALDAAVLFALGAMLCWGVGDFLIQRTVRKAGDLEALAFIGVIGSVGLIPFVWPELKLLLSAPNLTLLLWLGVVTFVAAILYFEALKAGKLSVIEVLLEIELPVTIALGYLFFREALTALQLMLSALIFAGIILIAFKGRPLQRAGIEKGIILGILAAVGMGLANFLTAASSKQVSPILAIWGPWVIFTLMSLSFIARRGGLRDFAAHANRHRWLILATGAFDTAAWLFYAHGLRLGELSITTAITESYPAIAILLGLWLNKERIRAHQGIGVALALGASAMLAFWA